MRLALFYITLISFGLLSCVSQSASLETNEETISNSLSEKPITSVTSPSIVHGAGFARLSNFNPSRSFQEAKENAITDLEASILTSVYLEYYGTDDTPSRLKSEFGISDSLLTSQIAIVDSLQVDEWAIFFIKDVNNTTQFPSSLTNSISGLSWDQELFEPRKINGYWIASGLHEQTRFNPDRGWTKAKQNALQNLSEYLNTSVQSLQRTYDNDLSSVHYVTSKHIFNNIGVLGRQMRDGVYYVLVVVKEEDLFRIDS